MINKLKKVFTFWKQKDLKSIIKLDDYENLKV